MSELSIIIPFVNEWPQIIWTIRSIAEELIGRVDFEIIAIDNYNEKEVNKPQDKGGKHVMNVSRGHKWLKCIEYRDRLSHWNAKRVGIENSTGEILFFCDGHVAIARDALYKAFKLYQHSHKALQGTLHLPLTYQIMEWHKLIYKLQVDRSIGKLHYSFSSYRDAEVPYEVPCMSTCGMLMTREIYDDIGGWPEDLGIYGGGENFMNFVSAILGYKKWIMPGGALYHHGDKRGYSWNGTDFIKNRMVANYLFGGREWLYLLTKNARGRPAVLKKLQDMVIESCSGHRNMLKAKQKISIDRWIEQWRETPGL